jgi:hypothetical protein
MAGKFDGQTAAASKTRRPAFTGKAPASFEDVCLRCYPSSVLAYNASEEPLEDELIWKMQAINTES